MQKVRLCLKKSLFSCLVDVWSSELKTVNEMLDFRKVLRTIFSDSGAPSAFGAQFILVYFSGFCPFQIFSVPIYRAITKRIGESIVSSLTKCEVSSLEYTVS